MFYPRGEEVAARAAGEAGTTYMLSTLSGCRVEDVKAATRGPVWFQLYLVGGRDVATRRRSHRAQGRRLLGARRHHRHAGRRHARTRFRNGTKELIVAATRSRCFRISGSSSCGPAGWRAFLRDGGLMKFPNIVLPDGPMPYADVGAALEQSMVCWNDSPLDPRRVERTDRREGRAHRRRCAARDG